MKKQTSQLSKLNYVTGLLLLTTLVLVVNALPSISTISAGHEKASDKVIKYSPYSNQPIEITDVTVKGKSTKLNAKIDENADDWLSDLSITVKNVSDKTITHITLNLEFPETKETGNPMFFPLRFGQNPQVPISVGQPEALPANQITTLYISGQTLTKLKSFIEKRQPLNSLKKVSIHPGTVYFEDKSLWTGGSFFRIDPNDPSKYIRVEN
ncbi:MAG TPA: hypothetical protein VIQ24_23095 [Pyrinomonadaceae bacterium]